MFETTNSAGVTCRRCGISRPTLRLWLRRFRLEGEAGLVGRSRRPKHSPRQKVFAAQRDQILSLRRERNLGARRIQSELRLRHEIELSITSVQKILDNASVAPLRKPRRSPVPKRYSRPIPGDRVQMDTMKIVPGVYQYTAVDDCTRFRVLGVYKRSNGTNTLDFLSRVVEEMPFPIQRIQTDRGGEFFAQPVQTWFANNGIKFRPNPPRSPHLNGKVERSQLTDLQEFWAQHDPRDPDIGESIEHWQFDYNWRRPHGSLGGKCPGERLGHLSSVTPLSDEVARSFDRTRERARHRNFKIDLAMAALWQSRQEISGASAAAASDRPVSTKLKLRAQNGRANPKPK
jgi:transposase InsO family protein